MVYTREYKVAFSGLSKALKDCDDERTIDQVKIRFVYNLCVFKIVLKTSQGTYSYRP